MNCLHPLSHTSQITSTLKVLFGSFSNNLIINSEIVYQNLPEFIHYKDKSILIIGGGPSTRDVKWQNISVDYRWSLNHFFLNNQIQHVDLATLSNEVDLESQELINYINSNKNIILGFEPNLTWSKIGVKINNIKDARLFCMATRFTSVLGGLPRLMILAHFLGVENIYVVGFDGSQKMIEGDHVFTPGKTTLPVKVNRNNAVNQFDIGYKSFFNYWYFTLKSQTKIFNLGEYLDYNMPSKFTKQFNPLSEEIKNKISG